jgi:hypothetical protein
LEEGGRDNPCGEILTPGGVEDQEDPGELEGQRDPSQRSVRATEGREAEEDQLECEGVREGAPVDGQRGSGVAA